MPFCTNCGQEVAEGAKFCSNCGTATDKLDICSERRRVTYAGEVRKCPSCGTELPSMTATCPNCGYEINLQRIHPVIERFSEELRKCDWEIAFEEQKGTTYTLKRKSGWASWSGWAKLGWFFLNIYTLCIPLVFYRIKRGRPFTPATISKATLIENFQIPNEKEAIIEALYFVQAKIDVLLSQGTNETTLYWINLWIIKATSLYEKANAVLPGDPVVSDIYRKITVKAKKIKSVILFKRVGIVIAASFFIIVAIFSNHIVGTETKYYNITEFTNGYEHAEFSKFNSYASENGLGGTKIYVKGVLEKIELLQTDIYGFVTDDSNNQWLVWLRSVLALNTQRAF